MLNYFGTEESYRYRTGTGTHTKLPEYQYTIERPTSDYLGRVRGEGPVVSRELGGVEEVPHHEVHRSLVRH